MLFVATAVAGDEEMKHRIEEHRKTRPASWHTLEVNTRVGNHIAGNIGDARVVIVDCITLLINNILDQFGARPDEPGNAPLIEEMVAGEISQLIDCIDRIDAGFIIVTNEVGLGLVPANTISRLYRDLLGRANQMLAQQSREVYLMVAGLPLPVKNASQKRPDSLAL